MAKMSNGTEVISKIFLIVVFSILFVGCASKSPISVAETRSNLNKIELGMSKAEVVSLMGEPFQREMFLNSKGEAIEVLLYQTKFVGMAISPNDNSLMPVVFKNKKLIGWGRNFYDTTKKYQINQNINIRKM
jgi:hypothetical protein